MIIYSFEFCEFKAVFLFRNHLFFQKPDLYLNKSATLFIFADTFCKI